MAPQSRGDLFCDTTYVLTMPAARSVESELCREEGGDIFFFKKGNISHSAPFSELSEYKLNEEKRKKDAQH